MRRGEGGHIEAMQGSGTLIAVADGMGGHQEGDLASTAAVHLLAEVFRNSEKIHGRDSLFQFYLTAHKELYAKAVQRGSGIVKMGTTLTSVWLQEEMAHWCHIGDSRLYRWHRGGLQQISKDHTRGEFAQREGSKIPEEASGLLAQNFIFGSRGLNETQAIQLDFNLDSGSLSLEAGDWLLLCTDGLYNYVEEDQILQMLAAGHEPQLLCRQLASRAMSQGSTDNITLIVVKVEGLESAELWGLGD